MRVIPPLVGPTQGGVRRGELQTPFAATGLDLLLQLGETNAAPVTDVNLDIATFRQECPNLTPALIFEGIQE
jgi:hypothetical protein